MNNFGGIIELQSLTLFNHILQLLHIHLRYVTFFMRDIQMPCEHFICVGS
ncbi:hypothetical protein Pfeifenkraut_BL3003 [Xanthomonas phage Pfeifenkraut]|uniref:Uncharacterized protein n=1 Tax=Xanthomonas phage Pfeifenkraut TaxID=2939132 RepID=A0A9E7E337_9CAUD|nr:hypothetical protein QAY91_gp03 [Xanthomonas phage Pfeifenkraut]URA06900.1 hypothetical protein Pfeifenkraut_BL3003 [Xanthomonas phage Pfeifenkraut]